MYVYNLPLQFQKEHVCLTRVGIQQRPYRCISRYSTEYWSLSEAKGFTHGRMTNGSNFRNGLYTFSDFPFITNLSPPECRRSLTACCTRCIQNISMSQMVFRDYLLFWSHNACWYVRAQQLIIKLIVAYRNNDERKITWCLRFEIKIWNRYLPGV